MILEFFVGVVLARLLGAKGYGAYAFAMSWATLLGIPAALGFDRLLVREIAVLHARSEWGLMRGLLRRGHQFSLLASVALAATAAMVLPAMSTGLDRSMVLALNTGMIIIPLIAYSRVRQAVLQGLGWVTLGQAPETIIYPLAFLTLIIVLSLVGYVDFSAQVAVAANAIAASLAGVVGFLLLRHLLPLELSHSKLEYRTLHWLRTALPFVWMLGMNVVVMYANIILLGFLMGPDEAGIFRVVSSLGALIAFPHTAVNLAVAPKIARHFALGEFGELQRSATSAARSILFLSSPILLAFMFFGDQILLLFGSEFVAGNTSLTLLSLGYLVNVCMGTSGYLLIMTKHERATAVMFSASAALSVALGYILIPTWGLDGAAIAMALSIAFVSIAFAAYAFRKLGIHPTAIAVGASAKRTRS